MKRLVAIILLINIFCIGLALFVHVPLPFDFWRKGPPIHAASAYSSGNASRIFWIATAGLLDTYLLLIFLFYFFVIKKGIFPRGWFYSLGIFVIFAVSLVVVEYGVRFYIKNSSYYTQFRPHPLLYWWNRPNLKDFNDPSDAAIKSTNSVGFRYGSDIPYDKPEGEYRIFVLGDSSTFGHGVRDDETFAARLEKMLDEKLGKNVRVINAACPGHTMYQNLVEFREMILSFDPDAIIVANNDDHALEYVEDSSRACANPFLRSLNIVLYKSDYYLLFQRVAMDFKIYFLNKLKIIPPPSLVRRVSLEDYEKNIGAIIMTAEFNGIWPIFIKMPINKITLDRFSDLKDVVYDERYPVTLSRVCLEKDALLVDIDSEWGGREDGLYENFHYKSQKLKAPYHPSAKGHLAIAGQICDEMITLRAPLKYFVPSDWQDSFVSLKNGRVTNTFANNFTVIFDIDIDGIESLAGIDGGELVSVFYERGRDPLKVAKIVPIERYGSASCEEELFKIKDYIQGRIHLDDGTVEAIFNIDYNLTYAPEPITLGDSVDIVYSQGLFKPPLARRVIKSKELSADGDTSIRATAESALLEKHINEDFYENWLSMGMDLWKKISHERYGSNRYYDEAIDLFESVAAETADRFGTTRDKIMEVVEGTDYVKGFHAQ